MVAERAGGPAAGGSHTREFSCEDGRLLQIYEGTQGCGDIPLIRAFKANQVRFSKYRNLYCSRVSDLIDKNEARDWHPIADLGMT